MIITLLILQYLLFGVLNIGMAKFHAYLIKLNKKISHGWWALLYGTLCAVPAYFLYKQTTWPVGLFDLLALLPLHISFFAVALNRYRGLPEFFLSTTSTAILDKTLVRLGFKNMEWPDMIAQFISVGFLILTLYNAS